MTAVKYDAVIMHVVEYTAAHSYVNRNLFRYFSLYFYISLPGRLGKPRIGVSLFSGIS